MHTAPSDVGYDQRTLEAKDYCEYLYVQQKGIGAEFAIFDTVACTIFILVIIATFIAYSLNSLNIIDQEKNVGGNEPSSN